MLFFFKCHESIRVLFKDKHVTNINSQPMQHETARRQRQQSLFNLTNRRVNESIFYTGQAWLHPNVNRDGEKRDQLITLMHKLRRVTRQTSIGTWPLRVPSV